jgi:hypothetical protein
MPEILLQIDYKDEKYYLLSPLELHFSELDIKFQPKSPYQKWEETKNPIPENKLFEFRVDFLKFHIYAY